MGQINLEIPDETHDNIRDEAKIKGVPQKLLIIDALRQRYRTNPDLMEQIQEMRSLRT